VQEEIVKSIYRLHVLILLSHGDVAVDVLNEFNKLVGLIAKYMENKNEE